MSRATIPKQRVWLLCASSGDEMVRFAAESRFRTYTSFCFSHAPTMMARPCRAKCMGRSVGARSCGVAAVGVEWKLEWKEVGPPVGTAVGGVAAVYTMQRHHR